MITGKKINDEMAEIIRQRYPYTKTEVLARELGVSYRTVCRWAASMGIKKTEHFMSSMSFAGATGLRNRYGSLKGKPRTLLNDDIAAWMQLHYATTPDKEIANLFGIHDRTVRHWAEKLGLRKDHDYIVMARRIQFSPTPEERFRTICIIRELYPDGRDKEASELTGYSVGHIYKLAKEYGINRSDEYINRKLQKQLAVIREFFPDGCENEAAERLGIQAQRVCVIAKRNGIKRSDKYIRKRTEQQKKQMNYARKFRYNE